MKSKLETFFQQKSPLLIVNISTQIGLLFLRPSIEEHDDSIIVNFDSLNERGGNSIDVVELKDAENKDTLFLINEEKNILMIQKITLKNYYHYLKNGYANSIDADNEETLIKQIEEL